ALTGDGLRAVISDSLVRRTAQTATGPVPAVPASLLALVPNLAPSGLGVPAAALGVLIAGFVAVICLTPPTRADRPPAQPGVARTPDRPPAETGENDPLPAGAAARFGFPRFRTGAVTRAQVSPDGQFLAVPSRGGLLIWDLGSGRYLTRLPSDWRESQSPNLDVFCFTADGKLLATVVQGGLTAYTIESGKFVPKTWPSDKGGDVRRSVPLSRTARAVGLVAANGPGTGHRLIVQTDDARPFLADLDEGAVAATRGRVPGIDDITWLLAEYFPFVKGKPGAKIERRTFVSPSRQRAVVMDRTGFDVVGANPRTYSHRPTSVEELADINGAMTDAALFLGRPDGGINRLALDTEDAGGQLRGHPLGAVSSLAATPDGKTLVSLGTDHVIRRWDLETNTEIPPPDGYLGYVKAAISPDGQWVAAGDAAGRVDVWNVNTHARRTLRARGPSIHALQWLPDGRSVVAFVEPETLLVWDARTRQEIRSVALHGRPEPVPADHWFSGVALSPDGSRAVRVLARGGTWCYDTRSGQTLWRHARTGDAVFSPDGTTLAIGRPSQGFHVLDAATGRVVRTVGISSPVTPTADQSQWTFTPDGQALVVPAGGAKALEDGLRPTHGVALLPSASAWGRTVTAVSPDGRWLAIGYESGSIVLFETASGARVREIGAHLGPVSQLTFSPDSRRLLSAGRDLTVLLWDVHVSVANAKSSTQELWARARCDPDFFPALCALADRSDVVDLFRERFRAAVGPPPEEIVRAIFHLESDRYPVREAAYKQLTAWGPLAEAAMRTALTRGWSAETVSRLETILDTLPRPRTEEEIAQSRAVFVLETTASPAARRLLEEWATGADGAWLTEQSRAALKRLRGE
ncbi:MAG: hypothetical protein J2P46_03045, partial [Zavarzinella sp.]|nr:hypothetical protein [Zavarzinella sp.]